MAPPWLLPGSESWRDPAGELLRTFTIATTAANDDMARLHDRMLVILEEDTRRYGWVTRPGTKRSCWRRRRPPWSSSGPAAGR